MLAAHDVITAISRNVQDKLGTLLIQGRHAAHRASLPGTARPPGPGDPLGGCETKAFAKTRCRSLQEARTTACLRVRLTDSLRVAPTTEMVGMGRRFIEIEERVAAYDAPAAMQLT